MKRRRQLACMVFMVVLLALSTVIYAGNLEPSAAPGPTMKTLDEVEPRIPIHTSDLPLTITEPNSYYFAENLVFNTADASAITISNTSGVTIDLNGFALIGPGKSVGTTGNGITINGSCSQISVKNGTVSEFRQNGVKLLSNSVVTGILSDNNGEAGIRVDNSCLVTKNICSNNGGGTTMSSGRGIYALTACVISENTCYDNGQSETGFGLGISASSGCTIANNACYDNDGGATSGDGYGIYVSSACTIIGNACFRNSAGNGSATGIYVSSNNVVNQNNCYDNSTYSGGTAYGIKAGSANLIRENVCSFNKGYYGSNSSGYGIHCLHYNNVIRNTCAQSDGDGTAANAAGIRVEKECRVEGNECILSTGAIANYGILIEGDKSVVISNTCSSNGTSDIHFDALTSNGYAGANLTDFAITDAGANNEAGTTPAANDTF